VPLNNGRYVDAAAATTNQNLRVLGQKDGVSGRAHLWIDNKTHTWSNVAGNTAAIAPQSGTVSVPGLPPGACTVSWVDPYSGSLIRTESKTVDGAGTLRLDVTALARDVAVKVER
jgi:hypothetical protein